MKSSAPQHTGLTDVERVRKAVGSTLQDDGKYAMRMRLSYDEQVRIAEAAIAATQHPVHADEVGRILRQLATGNGVIEGTDFIRVSISDLRAALQVTEGDVKQLLREARSYVEQAGLRHHDVSGLLAEIDAVLLVSNRSGVERLKGVIYRNCDPFDATAEDARVIQEIANEMAALDIPTINEGEGQ